MNVHTALPYQTSKLGTTYFGCAVKLPFSFYSL